MDGRCWHCGRRLDPGDGIGELLAVSSLSCDLDGAPVRSRFSSAELWSNRFHVALSEQASPVPSTLVPPELLGPLISPRDGAPIECARRSVVRHG